MIKKAYYRAELNNPLFKLEKDNENSQRLKVEKTKIHKIAKKFAEIAMSAGLTNNEEEFAEEMTNTIFNAYKDVEEKYAKENKG